MHASKFTFDDDPSGKEIAYIENGDWDGYILTVTESPEVTELDLGKDATFKVGKINPILDPNKRSVVYIAGPSGSGKSTFAASLLKIYCYPRVMYFGRGTENLDPAYENCSEIECIDINSPDFVVAMENLKLESIEPGSVLIFDDVLSVMDTTVKDVLIKLMVDAMEIGRKLNLNVIITSHVVIPIEQKFARKLLPEIQDLVVFPGFAGRSNINYVLTKHIQLEPSQVRRILDTKTSRWVLVHTTVPMYVLTEKEAYML